MSWIMWLLLAAVVALVIVVLRGIAQLVSWFFEEFIPEPKDAGRAKTDVVEQNDQDIGRSRGRA